MFQVCPYHGEVYVSLGGRYVVAPPVKVHGWAVPKQAKADPGYGSPMLSSSLGITASDVYSTTSYDQMFVWDIHANCTTDTIISCEVKV